MFSHFRPVFKICVFKNVIRGCQNQANLEKFLIKIRETPPKQGYSLVFFDEEVQKLMKKVSNIELSKVFRERPFQKQLSAPVYKLMTTEELEKHLKEAEEKAEYLLQIPPLVNITEDKVDVLDPDTSLDGYDIHHSKTVFVDISHNRNNYNRAVVVREPNGTLRTAIKSERLRVNQIYFPLPGREIEIPHMFEYENLVEVIKRKDYEFILDRACVQFEPDELNYHKVISLTYEAINFCEDFEMLHSTRHFGSLVFYLVTHKNIDKMLNENILKDRIEDAVSLVRIYHLVHPDCKSAEISKGKSDLEMLTDFIKLDSTIKDTLKRSLDFYIRKQKSEAEVTGKVKEAHGL